MSIFRCACCCGPREKWRVDVWMPSVATCNRAWLWHPEDGESYRSLRCHWMLMSAFMNDQVDLVPAWYENIWNIENMSEDVNIELLGVCCQTTFVPMRPAVPYQCSQFSWANAWGRQSWCGSTMVKFRSSNHDWKWSDMIWQRREERML